MKLYSITDREKGDRCEFGWNEAVWANDEAEALQYAKDNYGGECRAGDDPGIWILSIYEADREPEEPLPYRERSLVVLRDAGWMEESDTGCDYCGLYSLGMDEYRVCEDCYLCRKCRKDEREDTCETCQE